jgi:ABC-type glycerol-3-phosphate transport system substrate-binding protein
VLVSLVVSTLIPGVPVIKQKATAQENTVITIGVPAFMQDMIRPEAIERFEAEHTVDVVVVPVEDAASYPGFPRVDLEGYLQNVENFAGSADVLLVNKLHLTPESIRAGYFLDLTPLSNVDATLDRDDFFPTVIESLEWNGGLWGLPRWFDVSVLTYDETAFDNAGLAYPNESWSLTDFANAARELAVFDNNGEVVTPGMLVMDNGVAAFFRSLLDENLYDDSQMPAAPMFDNPAIISLLQTWAALQEEDVLNSQGFSGDPLRIPLKQGSIFETVFAPGPNEQLRSGTLLPGGVSAMQDVQAFSISAGTQYPEEAYALVKFLTSEPDAFTGAMGISEARRSLAETGGFMLPPDASPEATMLVERAIANVQPLTDTFYADYLLPALDTMVTESIDAQTALNEAEALVVANLQAADERRANLTLSVSPPPQAAPLPEGEIALRFGIMAFVSSLPNEDAWEAAAERFGGSDREVGRVDIELQQGFGGEGLMETMTQNYDCFYLPFSTISPVTVAPLLNIDPFLGSDATFQEDDLVGNVLQRVQWDNRTWAYPLDIKPQVIWYEIETLQNAGVVAPTSDWMGEDLALALREIEPYTDMPSVLSSQIIGSNHLLMLMAGYGGLPLDFRTQPPTVDFTSPANLQAIRQVLDLAKEGYIAYQPLDFVESNGVLNAYSGPPTPFYSDFATPFNLNLGTLSSISIGLSGGGGSGGGGGGGGGSPDAPAIYESVAFPESNAYVPVSYQLGAAYISAEAQNPAACYRWISEIAQRPELPLGMPVNQNNLDENTLTTIYQPELSAFYQSFAEALAGPTVVEFPEQVMMGVSPSQMLIGLLDVYWLHRAFDNYVLENAELEVELEEAELFTTAYQECVAQIPAYDPAAYIDQSEYFQQFNACAARVDPNLSVLAGS